MAKSSEYKTVARALAGYWMRARLMSDFELVNLLYDAMNVAVEKAKALAIAEVAAKAKG